MVEFSTLVPDIYRMVEAAGGGIAPLDDFKKNIAERYIAQTSREYRDRKPNTLYFSEIGTPCDRKLWYGVNRPRLAEPVAGPARIKFAYGDILEEMVLQLARDAGHSVEDEQKEIEYGVDNTGWVVRGRLDAVVDGVTTDVKSVTKYSVRKFEDGLVDDPFGYYNQLNGYATALKNNQAAFITIEKELGNIKAFPIAVNPLAFQTRARDAVSVVMAPTPDALPRQPVVKLDNGNEKLGTMCSYCPYKKECWEGLRTFIYSSGPVYLTKVVSLPKVLEIVSGKDQDQQSQQDDA